MSSTGCHTSPYAGLWYPNDRFALEQLLAKLFEDSESRDPGTPLPGGVGFVVPHAGLEYSGQVAAAVYQKLAVQQPGRIVLLGFAHRGAPPGVWIPDIGAYRTPLGETAVDREAVQELVAAGAARLMSEDLLCDNSVELQLPLLAKTVPDTPIAPLFVSSLKAPERNRIAKILAPLVADGGVLVASSDFTHYGDRFRYKPFAADDTTAERLRELDEGFFDAAGSLDAELFLDALNAESATVCGRQPIALLLETLSSLPGAEEIFQQTLDYATSGDVTGDYQNSVGYAALGYYPWESYCLGERDGQSLLECAHATLRYYLEHGRAEPRQPKGASATLERRGAAFVTLRQGGRLRGCIGRLRAEEPLASVVPQMTLSAALDDRRFSPVGREETDIEIEISLLSPMKRLADRRRFQVNRDGGYLRSGLLSGLLLPQVAESRDWTSEQFLTALARKAGAPDDVYDQPETKLYTFRAQIVQ